MAFEPKEFGIVIIESLRANDEKTGQKLYDEVVKYKCFEEPNLLRQFYSVNSKQEFLDVLGSTYQKVCDDALFPIIHIEAHGYEDGLQLSSDEIITWNECMPTLRKINVHIENSLLMVIAACKGARLAFRPNPSDRAPFRAVIGSLRNISERELLIAFEAFYSTYFFSLNPDSSIDAMNSAILDSHAFDILTSAQIFDEMLNADRNPEFFKQLVLEKAIEEKAKRGDYAYVSLDILRFKWDYKIRQLFEEQKRGRDYFTMSDIRGIPVQ